MAVVWSEGTAVWNEEQTFPEQGDYERLVAEFLVESVNSVTPSRQKNS